MSIFQNWTLTITDRVANLTLNRSAHMNSLTPETLLELREITAYLRDDPTVWAIILEGAGEHFSVGVDVNAIGQMIGQDPAAYRENLRTLQSCLDAFEALSKPTIAKIRGYCIGGGCLLALCCDFRLASQTAQFSFPEVKRGIAVIMGTQRITRIVGIARAKELVMLGEPLSAQQAYDYGMLNALLPDEELDAAAAAFADKFRRLPPLTVSVCKRIADEGEKLSLRQSQELEIELQAALLNTADFQEAVVSFFEKRPPTFVGR